ncbi:MAG TPA: 50S ribosomal protein L6 [Oligoflexia bacterium]|nr:50S ribosomal protein L6 [Oligoflexia bacterium]HMP49191.1 50S ribosomal protein L6 [Oligoflexia bacterium]
MSRVGKLPIDVPKGVTANVTAVSSAGGVADGHLAGQLLKIEGPKGKLSREIRPEIKVSLVDGKLTFEPVSDGAGSGAFHGMERALAANMVKGVSEGFVKELALIGTGYRAEQAGKTLTLSLGYSHPIDFPVPDSVKASVVKDGRDVFIRLESADKQALGQVAAQIRALRPPEPYKGKGVRYRDEVVKLKAGKSGKK